MVAEAASLSPPGVADLEPEAGPDSFRLVLMGVNGSQRELTVPDEHALVRVMAETHRSEAPIEIRYSDGRILDYEMSEKVHQRLFFRLALHEPNALPQRISECLAETIATMEHAGRVMKDSERLLRKYDELKGVFVRSLHYLNQMRMEKESSLRSAEF